MPLGSQVRLCVITDRRLARGRSHAEVARQALAGGATMIQLRDKEAGSRELHETAVLLRRITREHGALLIVNDRADIALASEADGVHVGQDDLPVAAARRLLGPRAVVGASARNPYEALAAERAGADYLGVGPIHEARGSKPDTLPPQGVELLRRIAARVRLPLLAIGGIGASNAAEIIDAGASGVAVISAVVAAEDIAAATAELLAVVDGARPSVSRR